MSAGDRKGRRRSAGTSGPVSTIRSLLRSRLGTMLGFRRGRSSPTTSRPDRLPGSRHGRSPRRVGSTNVESEQKMATTELSRLPGLEAVTEHSRPEPGHYLERGPQKRLMVFSGRSHPDLAQRIAEKLGVELGAVELSTFANDETYCRYDESIRGADVFLVQTGCPPVDKNLME